MSSVPDPASTAEKWPISQDPKIQNQVAGILLLREMERIARGEPTELERNPPKRDWPSIWL